MEKINGNIYKKTMPYKDIFTTVCVIKTDIGALLFDAASFDEDVENYILPLLGEAGVKDADLKYIFISHNHRDHAGALEKLMERFPDVTVLSRSLALKEKFEKYRVELPEDGDTILGVLKVVTIPGHTDDAMAVYDTRTKTMLTGDGLQLYGIFGSENWGSNMGLPVEHIEAIKKLRGMDIAEIYTAHDYHPCGTNAKGAAEIGVMLDACVEPIMLVKNLIENNPEKSDEEIRLLYNNSAKIPPISTRLVIATREAMRVERI